MEQSNTLARNAQWFEDTGQLPPDQLPSVRQTAFYTGMQCEELSEKLSAIFGEGTAAALHELGLQLKRGDLDQVVADAIRNPKAVIDMLDGDMDLVFVSVGAAKAMGADVPDAYERVVSRNEEKRFEDGTYHRAPDTGKVLKPEGWTPPDLRPALHPSLQ